MKFCAPEVIRSATIIVAMLVPLPVSAAPLDVGRLPEGTKWVIHVDLEAARASGLFAEIGNRWPGVQRAQQKVRQIENTIGIKLSRDISHLTAYDHRYQKDSGVVLVEVNALDASKLVDHLKQQRPQHTTTTHAGRVIYAWVMQPGRPQEHEVSGSIHGETVILSRSQELVRRAIDQLDGRGQTVASDSPLAAGSSQGTIVLARSVDMADSQTPFQSPVIRQARWLAIAAGKVDECVFVTATMEADSAATAKQCKDVVEGFRAIAALEFSPDETARRIFQGLTVKATDRVVSAEWQATVADMATAIQRHLEKQRKTGNN